MRSRPHSIAVQHGATLPSGLLRTAATASSQRRAVASKSPKPPVHGLSLAKPGDFEKLYRDPPGMNRCRPLCFVAVSKCSGGHHPVPSAAPGHSPIGDRTSFLCPRDSTSGGIALRASGRPQRTFRPAVRGRLVLRQLLPAAAGVRRPAFANGLIASPPSFRVSSVCTDPSRAFARPVRVVIRWSSWRLFPSARGGS